MHMSTDGGFLGCCAW